MGTKHWLESRARELLVKMLRGVEHGSVELVCPDRTYRFGRSGGQPHATVAVHDERFFLRALTGGDMGIGEAYMDGDWSSPDLTAVVRLAVRNLARLEESHRLLSLISRALDILRHRSRANTLEGARRNIRAHYDLSNDFFRLFLDPSMMYSCAFYEAAEDTLDTAQAKKLDRICRKLQLGPEDHVLEIGTGWGGFAVHAARHYGCRVTTTTISREQYEYAAERFAREGLAAGRIELLFEDYRHLRGRFDKLVSIEMFEAVGYRYYDEFFRACDRLLAPDGAMLLQTITILDQHFQAYRKRSDWIQKHIFPGSELASLGEILQSLARVTRMSLFDAEDMGAHYARTLADWRERFHGALPQVRALGFDERFIRMWDYYLAYCEGGFRERHISDFQLVLTKNHAPWSASPSRSTPARISLPAWG